MAPPDVHPIVATARAKFRVPAIAVATMSRAGIDFEGIQGSRVIDQPDPATLDDYFHIGSCSKSVLAMMAGRLVEQGKLEWNAKFFDLLPDLAAQAHAAYRDMTLEDLFLCRAGIKPYTNMDTEPLPECQTRLDFIRHVLALEPSTSRKDGRFQHLYSNASYTMVAAMLERAAALSYEEMVARTFDSDFGMAVHFGWPNLLGTDQPWGHLITRGGIQPHPPGHEYRLPDVIKPAGDIAMTPRDFARYTLRHLRGLAGRDDYLARETWQFIHFGHPGFSLGVANGKLAGHHFSGCDGSAGTFFCRAILVPDVDFAFTIMMNAGSGTGTMKAMDWLSMKIAKQHFGWWWMFWI